MMKVGLLVIATNEYYNFAQTLYYSMEEFFLNQPGIDRSMFLFTNQSAFPGPVHIYQDHEPWPGMTLKRYEIFFKNRHLLERMDYLYYCDADMLFVDNVGVEILGERVATLHPGFWNSPRHVFTYETNPLSTAYIGVDEGDYYYAGGFNGGSSILFLEMAKVISENVNKDLKTGYTAVWHDESHLNRYLIDHQPTVILNPSYCFPESSWARRLPFRKILVALDKNHNDIRN
jgi:histo-blood group ABO system transferase